MNIENKIESICNELFVDTGLDPNLIKYIDLIEDLNMDSLTFVSLVVEIENCFGIVIDDVNLQMEKFNNVDSIKRIVLETMNIAESKTESSVGLE